MLDGISIVICTFNGKERLRPTLHSVLEQERSCKCELILVDNNSTDSTANFCRSILQQRTASFSWHIVHEPKPGLNHARLAGLYVASFDVVLFCDDDNHLDKNYIQLGYDMLNTHQNIGALGGCGIPLFESEKPHWFDRFAHSFAVGPQADRNGKIERMPAEIYGAGSFYRKQVLLNFFDKGFHTIMSDRKGNTLASGGDVEWCYLVQLAGYEIWYEERLTFLHSMPAGRLTWEYYLKLKKGIASGAGKLLPYTSLLKDKGMSNTGYFVQQLVNTIKSTSVFCKHSFVRSFKKAGPEDQLAYNILQSKMQSYWRDRSNAFQHFRQLKALL